MSLVEHLATNRATYISLKQVKTKKAKANVESLSWLIKICQYETFH